LAVREIKGAVKKDNYSIGLSNLRIKIPPLHAIENIGNVLQDFTGPAALSYSSNIWTSHNSIKR